MSELLAIWNQIDRLERTKLRAPGIAPWAAGLVLATLIALIAAGCAMGVQRGKDPVGPGKGDLGLYSRIVDQVHAGQPYYPAMMDELRREGGGLKPFMTVRLPTVTVLTAALPDEGARILAVRLLAVTVFVAWLARLQLWRGSPLLGGLAALIMLTGLLPAFNAQAYLLHEVWGGLLVALSLAVRRPEGWLASVAIGLAACVTRELAAPYLLVMAALALREKRWAEGAAWLGALAVFAGVLTAHALTVAAHRIPSDTSGPGWTAAGGWPFVLHAASWNALVLVRERWIIVLYPLALLGLAFWKGPLGERVALTVLGYSAALMLFGRKENFYWGLMFAPLWPLGLIMAAPTLSMLVRRLSRLAKRRAPLAGAAA